jgi:antitoxin component YwqK of YwqJK toxin-antitoxin module
VEYLKGIYQNGERCGDWFELFKTISYPPCDGPVETKYANGKLRSKGIYKDGEKCGEWIDEGETVTYDPC